MPSKEERTSRRIKSKKHRPVLFILFLIIAALFFLYKEFGREDSLFKKPLKPEIVKHVKPAVPLPKVAVVIDDLGPNRETALEIFNLNVSFTLSILPHEAHTKWIADEGHRLGYDVIGHIPMEAKGPLSPGKGGLYTWMTGDEIIETLETDINSIPHLQGASNHMGSAFTEDERVMNIFMTVIKEHNLFFLDSLTTHGSAGFKTAEKQGLKALKRDVFLDNEESHDYIEAQWEQLIKIAQKKGHAVGLAHARKATIEFFRKTLPSHKVTVVPITELFQSN